MHVSSFTILAILPLSFAAPILSNRGFLGDVGNAVKGLVNSNATLSGVAGAVKQSIENPQLTASRVQVVKALKDTQSSLDQISAQADTTNNAGVTSLVSDAQQGLTSAKDAVNRIGAALVSGQKGAKDDQKAVAVGTKDALTAMNSMSAAITTPDDTLSKDIAGGIKSATSLKDGGEGVLAAEDLSLEDLGLPADFADV